jgi:Na+-driven multidrug efflux pump
LATGKNHLAEIRRTLHLALPVIIGQLAVFSMNFVDTVMSGRPIATSRWRRWALAARCGPRC